MIRFACVLLIAALAIVGVAMSSHNAAPAAHATATSVTAVEAGHDDQHRAAALAMPVTAVAAAGVPALAFGADCADCALDAHTMTLLACAFLALLVTLVLVRPRLFVALFAPRVVLRLAVARLADLAPALRPPDLLALGISRT